MRPSSRRSCRVANRQPWSAASNGVPDRLSEAAPAKINLYLHVTGRRDDGYHLLDSLAVFAGVGDLLRCSAPDASGAAAPPSCLTLALAGPFGPGLETGGENLVLRAAVALARAGGLRPV